MQRIDRLPVVVITGFLGSGKSTLLDAWLARPAYSQSAVLINEEGEQPLDHLLLEHAPDAVEVLSAGCVCCTVRTELVSALRRLLLKREQGVVPPFERVFIETSGLADPAGLIGTLLDDPALSQSLSLQTVICTVDASNALERLNRQSISLKQIALADTLVLTMQDRLPGQPPDGAQQLREALARLSPSARVLGRDEAIAHPPLLPTAFWTLDGKTLDARRWFGEAGRFSEAASFGFRHETLCYATPLDYDALRDAVQCVLELWGDQILRLKGLVEIEPADIEAARAHGLPTRQALAIHAVHHHILGLRVLEDWPAPGPPISRLVWVTQHLPPGAISRALEPFLGVPLADPHPLASESIA
jgi:G3E family GTPase